MTQNHDDQGMIAQARAELAALDQGERAKQQQLATLNLELGQVLAGQQREPGNPELAARRAALAEAAERLRLELPRPNPGPGAWVPELQRKQTAAREKLARLRAERLGLREQINTLERDRARWEASLQPVIDGLGQAIAALRYISPPDGLNVNELLRWQQWATTAKAAFDSLPALRARLALYGPDPETDAEVEAEEIRTQINKWGTGTPMPAGDQRR